MDDNEISRVGYWFKRRGDHDHESYSDILDYDDDDDDEGGIVLELALKERSPESSI